MTLEWGSVKYDANQQVHIGTISREQMVKLPRTDKNAGERPSGRGRTDPVARRPLAKSAGRRRESRPCSETGDVDTPTFFFLFGG